MVINWSFRIRNCGLGPERHSSRRRASSPSSRSTGIVLCWDLLLSENRWNLSSRVSIIWSRSQLERVFLLISDICLMSWFLPFSEGELSCDIFSIGLCGMTSSCAIYSGTLFPRTSRVCFWSNLAVVSVSFALSSSWNRRSVVWSVPELFEQLLGASYLFFAANFRFLVNWLL